MTMHTGVGAGERGLPLQPNGAAPSGELAFAAQLFNSSIVAFALVAASETGLLDELHGNGAIEIRSYATERDLHEPSVRAILDALACAGIVEITGGGHRATPGAPFPLLYETKGFFVWLLGGCGELLRSAGTIARNPARVGPFVHRDARVIGRSTADFGARFIDPRFDAAFGARRVRCIADFGCGSGDRLVRMVLARPDARGVGVDISEDAVELARERVAQDGLDDRVKIVRGDVRQLEQRPEFEEVDFATCFLMGHDFWPREPCVAVLRRLRTTFPKLDALVLCDTYRSGLVPSADVPLLTLGFEYVHALMGKYVPTLAEWREAFSESGWKVRGEVDIPMPPHTKIFDLAPVDRYGV
jgi:SAM-dependent methyltransferase